MYSIKKTAIKLTRGDTFRCKVCPTYDGEPYTPVDGDEFKFLLSKEYGGQILIEKIIPTADELILHLVPEDTKSLAFTTYYYDIQLTNADGDVDTFIQGTLEIAPEVG